MFLKKWKRRVNSDLQALDDKNLEKILEETDKLCWDWIGRAREVKKLLKKYEQCDEHMREKPF